MTKQLTRNKCHTRRALALLGLVITLTTFSTRLHAEIEATGTCNAASVSIPFTDVSGNSTFFCAIAAAYTSGLTNGTSATTYSPSQNVPREQMAAFITRTLDQSLKRGNERAALGQWWTQQFFSSSAQTSVGGVPSAVVSDGESLLGRKR